MSMYNEKAPPGYLHRERQKYCYPNVSAFKQDFFNIKRVY